MLIRTLIVTAIVVCMKLKWSFCAQMEEVKICVPRKDDIYKKRERYCLTLAQSSNIKCVLAVDKTDCFRKIQKNEAHFGVFSSEDLLAARWYGTDMLVVSELRFSNRNYEFEVVAVVDSEANINSVHDLHASKLCHPGYGLVSQWTSMISNYLESVLTAKRCEDNLTMYESRIKASAEFFGPSCKAGPWEENKKADKILKNKYPSLCQLCSSNCETGDKYWGRAGVLECLTNGGGDVAWARLDDAREHFGISSQNKAESGSRYSFLCLDGGLQPLNSKYPCVWVAKPWPIIAAKRKYSQTVQDLMYILLHGPSPLWSDSFLMLLEDYFVNVTNVDVMIPVSDYLYEATGYESAHSFHQCDPPRSIILCTTTIIEYNKCTWLEESCAAIGVEPNIGCIRSSSISQCMMDVKNGEADVVRVFPDDYAEALNNRLLPILFEYINPINTTADTNHHSQLQPIKAMLRDSGIETKYFAPSALMIRTDNSDIRKDEIFNTFKKIDKEFGKQKDSRSDLFKLYGAYDGKNDVLFFDTTTKLIGKKETLSHSENNIDYQELDRLIKLSSQYLENGTSNIFPNFILFLAVSLNVLSALRNR